MCAVAVVACLTAGAAALAHAQPRPRADWVALAKSGFSVPAGTAPLALLTEMNALLASPDPVLRDDVAYAAAERWILRDRFVGPDDLRALLAMWSANLDDGLGASGEDRVFKRSFSALCLSLIAARDVATPFLSADDVQRFVDRALDYFAREQDLRGFDASRGWMHTVAHTADLLKFLARSATWAPANLARLLDAMRAKIESSDAVFVWGENDRMALALHSAVRRPDADTAVVDAWIARWMDDHTALWANGPLVNPRQFARVENARQVLRGLHAALAMDQNPTPKGEFARRASLAALARMR